MLRSRISAAIAVVFAMIACAAIASENNVGGLRGFGWPNSDKDCFQSSSEVMINFCSDPKLLVIPMTFEFSGLTWPTARISGNGSQSSWCQAMAFHADGSGVVNAPVFTTGSPSIQALPLGSLTPGDEGVWHVECLMPQYAQLQRILQGSRP